MTWSVTLMRTERIGLCKVGPAHHCLKHSGEREGPGSTIDLTLFEGAWGIGKLAIRAGECESRSCPSFLPCGSLGEGKMPSFAHLSTPAAGGGLTHPHTSFSTPENRSPTSPG